MDIPQAIGRYEILERVGTRVPGVAYLARDPLAERLVTIEVCTSADETLRRRFVREAEIAGNLHHRHIVTVFELGHDEAGPFLVQEYLDGEDLDSKIRRADPPPLEVRLGYLLQIARALEYAHKKGILHRDLGPANVRILPDDRAKVVGFGTAKLSGAESRLVQDGSTPAAGGYLAPEQIRGEPVDARSDVFSFGVLAFELLSGFHPFPGGTSPDPLDGVARTGALPLPSLCPSCPPEVAAMVARCLETDPERRYEGFGEVAGVLASILAGVRSAPRGAAEPAAARDGSAQGPPSSSPETRSLPPDAGASPAVPTAQDLEATQQVPLDRPARVARSGRVGVAALVLGGCVVLAVAAVWTGWRRTAAPAEVPAAPAEPGRAPAAGAPAPGRLLVDAVPWGEVVRLRDATGREVGLPADASTPLVLLLPPGRYTAEISHPDAPAIATCEADVTIGGTSRCAAELHQLEPLDYFRQAGWWD